MVNTSGINVRGHRVLILPDQIEEVTKSGIVISTGSYTDREQMAQMKGVVVSIGNTAWADQVSPWAEIGDEVVFAKYSGATYKGSDEKEYRIISDLDIVATLDKKG
jgi:co-chaperonin GroES (HSP10)